MLNNTFLTSNLKAVDFSIHFTPFSSDSPLTCHICKCVTLAASARQRAQLQATLRLDSKSQMSWTFCNWSTMNAWIFDNCKHFRFLFGQRFKYSSYARLYRTHIYKGTLSDLGALKCAVMFVWEMWVSELVSFQSFMQATVTCKHIHPHTYTFIYIRFMHASWHTNKLTVKLSGQRSKFDFNQSTSLHRASAALWVSTAGAPYIDACIQPALIVLAFIYSSLFFCCCCRCCCWCCQVFTFSSFVIFGEAFMLPFFAAIKPFRLPHSALRCSMNHFGKVKVAKRVQTVTWQLNLRDLHK